jgi:hypothetical protein
MQQPNREPVVDPDNVPETLCLGLINVQAGPGHLATVTFTNPRSQAGPLFAQGTAVHEAVVRARIVMTVEQLVGLRDLLNQVLQQPTPVREGTTSVN